MELSELKQQEYIRRLLLSRMRILTKHGFYGLLLMHMDFALDEHCDTAATNGSKIFFGPDFLDKISDSELDFILMHEILHAALGHCFRTGERDNYMFNVACDIVVNSNILRSSGMDTDSITLDEFGESMHIAPNGKEGYEFTTEQVYEMLKSKTGNGKGKFSSLSDTSNNERSGKHNDNGQHINGAVWDDHSKWEEDAEQIAIWQQRVIDAGKSISLRGGAVPGCIDRMLGDLKKAQTDWRSILNDFVQEDITDYSFSPPDKRLYDSPFLMPDYNDSETTVKDILFMIDTSASISTDMMTAAFSEVAGAIEQFGGKLFGWLGFFDAKVIEPMPFESITDLKLIKPKGGGGTRFDIIFNYVRDNMTDNLPCCIIILTDGFAEFPTEDKAMNIPVLWLISTGITPPWGRVASVE